MYVNKRHTIFWKDKLSLFISNSHTHYSLNLKLVSACCIQLSAPPSLLSVFCPLLYWPHSFDFLSLCTFVYICFRKSKTLLVTQMQTQELVLAYTWLTKGYESSYLEKENKQLMRQEIRKGGIFLEGILSKYICILKLKV